MSAVLPYAKAVVAFLTPGVVTIGYALADGHVTGQEWGLALVAAFGTGVAVYGTKNQKEI